MLIKAMFSLVLRVKLELCFVTKGQGYVQFNRVA